MTIDAHLEWQLAFLRSSSQIVELSTSEAVEQPGHHLRQSPAEHCRPGWLISLIFASVWRCHAGRPLSGTIRSMIVH